MHVADLFGAATWGTSPSTKRTYSSLGGTPLPLYGKRQPYLQQQRARRRRRLVVIGCLVFVLINVTFWVLLSSHEASEDEDRLRSMRGRAGAPIMTDDEVLAAMYPLDASSTHSASAAGLGKECAQRWTLLLVEDPDEASAEPPPAASSAGGGSGQVSRWRSTLKRGSLCQSGGRWSVTWEDEVILSTSLNDRGRAMELSTLTFHRGKLLTCDDRTGIVYEVYRGHLLPRYILSDGDGEVRHGVGKHAGPGFKCEWATVRHGQMYIGSVGKEWVDSRTQQVRTPRAAHRCPARTRRFARHPQAWP